jgi:hypothetical protein
LRIGPITSLSVDEVFNKLSHQSRTEIEMLGKTVESQRAYFHTLANGELTATLFDDELEPLALVALSMRGNMTWSANLIMAEGAWKRIGMPLTHFFYRFCTDFAIRSGGTIEAFSPHGTGRTYDWYTTLGFVYDGEKDGLHRYLKKAG